MSPNTIIPATGLPTNKHVFVTGQTGKGKSNLLIADIMHMIEAGDEVHIVDSKDQLYQYFQKHATIYTPEQASDLIRHLNTVAKERRDLFNSVANPQNGPCNDIYEYEDITGIKLPAIHMVIEELMVITDLIDHTALKKFLALCRSSGIFCYALAQRANNDVIPSTIMTNFQVRVYLGAPDMYAFKSIFPGGIPNKIKAQLGSHLGPVGNALVYNDDEFMLMKFPYVSRELAKQFM